MYATPTFAPALAHVPIRPPARCQPPPPAPPYKIGLSAMAEKFKSCDFGRCPRVFCNGQPCLPVGLSDIPRQVGGWVGGWVPAARRLPSHAARVGLPTHPRRPQRRAPQPPHPTLPPHTNTRTLAAALTQSTVKLFCPKCEDVYYPRSKYHGQLDGERSLPPSLPPLLACLLALFCARGGAYAPPRPPTPSLPPTHPTLSPPCARRRLLWHHLPPPLPAHLPALAARHSCRVVRAPRVWV